MTQERHAALGIHPLNVDGDHEHLLKRQQIARRTRLLAAVLLALLALGAGRTLVARASNAKALDAAVQEQSRQYVQVAQPQRGAARSLALPGTLQGHVQAPIAARASGYLKRWTRDIGSPVAKGELLAEIETPEIDQQLTQAIAARAQSESSLNLARSTVARWQALRAKDVVSQQELDERQSAVAQGEANLAAAEANVARLRQLDDFRQVTAPFAGIITRRNIDVGDLIDAGAARPLFVLTQTDPLRVYLNVPQAYAHFVKPGQEVVVTQAELPGRSFAGQIARTAAAIDAASRTMQVEVTLPNRDGALLPGAYVPATLPMAAASTLIVPSNALIFRAEGTRVGVVDAESRVTLRPITLGRNFGDSIEVLDGLGESDRVVLNPADSLADGDQVVVATPKDPA
jgi:RND family efflux transporter MFP subunit